MAELVIYRRIKKDIFWHLDEDCANWPIEDYQEVISEDPPVGAFCSLCIHKHMEELSAQLKLVMALTHH